MGLAYLRGVATLVLDEEACTGCGICVEVCPHSVFAIKGSKVSIADIDSCMECGACTINCPFDALSVRAGVGCAKAIIRGKVGQSASRSCCSPPSPCGPGQGPRRG